MKLLCNLLFPYNIIRNALFGAYKSQECFHVEVNNKQILNDLITLVRTKNQGNLGNKFYFVARKIYNGNKQHFQYSFILKTNSFAHRRGYVMR